MLTLLKSSVPLRETLPVSVLKHIYFAFVRSRILYDIEMYANTSSSYLDKLIQLNNKLPCILQNKALSLPGFELHLDDNTLSISQVALTCSSSRDVASLS